MNVLAVDEQVSFGGEVHGPLTAGEFTSFIHNIRNTPLQLQVLVYD